MVVPLKLCTRIATTSQCGLKADVEHASPRTMAFHALSTVSHTASKNQHCLVARTGEKDKLAQFPSTGLMVVGSKDMVDGNLSTVVSTTRLALRSFHGIS